MSSEAEHQPYHLSNKQSQTHSQQQSEQFKLPRLGPPPSRGRLYSRKQHKQILHLPSISNDQQHDPTFRNTEMAHASKSQSDFIFNQGDVQSAKDEFALQIQQKLKNIMGYENRSTSENVQIQEDQENINTPDIEDDLDFEQKINQNKELIKQQRKKNQELHKTVVAKSKTNNLDKVNENSKPRFSKPQSNYERKMKDFNASLENKYLQKKKQSLGIIPEKPQKPVQRAKSKKILSLKEAVIQEARADFGYKQFKNNQISKSQSKDTSRALNLISINKSSKQVPSQPQKQSSKQPQKTQQPPSPSKKVNKTSALFDNIQSFLQNPTAQQKHEKLYKELFKKLKSKSIPKIEQQIKQINQKLNINENYDTKETFVKDQENRSSSDGNIMLTEGPTMERTVRDWKRLDIKDRHSLNCKPSDFQKQLDYISYLQEKNSSSLTRFIDQQKLMVELQLNRRFSKSIGKQQQHPHSEPHPSS